MSAADASPLSSNHARCDKAPIHASFVGYLATGSGMPVVFREEGIRFYFFSNEGNPREPVHIHADRSGAEAKLWLYPEVVIAESAGASTGES